MPKWIFYLLLLVSLIGYYVSGFYINRTNFIQLISLYNGLFLISFILLKYQKGKNLNILILSGVLFRFVLIFSVPSLSDDFYRFIWDGHIQNLGFNPFDFTPRQLINQLSDPFLHQIFPYLNSPDYYSVYPQVSQTIFKIASALSKENLSGNIIILKSIIFLAECGSIFLLNKLLGEKKLNPQLGLYYILNPLVILELTGNMHFEALMIFFVLLAAWLIEKQKYAGSIGAMALAILTKLIPFIAIPLLINKIGLRKAVWYGIICLVLTAFISMHLLNTEERFIHFFTSIQLYYGKFEFNGGLYLLLRTISWWILSYNPIAILSMVILFLAFAGMVYIYCRKMEILEGFFWLLVVYLVCSAIVHPWYLSPLIAFSAFVKYRFILIWSALVPVTYITYQQVPYSENYLLISIEYLLTFSWFVWEHKRIQSGQASWI